MHEHQAIWLGFGRLRRLVILFCDTLGSFSAFVGGYEVRIKFLVNVGGLVLAGEQVYNFVNWFPFFSLKCLL